jgi:hypothetical protein
LGGYGLADADVATRPTSRENASAHANTAASFFIDISRRVLTGRSIVPFRDASIFGAPGKPSADFRPD